MNMKNVIVAALCGSTILAGTASCIRPAYVAGALDALQITCILVEDFTDDEHILARACGVSDEKLPELRKLISARKTAAARKAARAASPASDAGISDSKDGAP